MSDDDSGSSPVDLARPEEEAYRLKALASEEYTSGNVEAAGKHAKRAYKLHPSLDGLPEMLAAFKILRTAAAPISETTSAAGNPLIDYYEILGVKQFAHIDVIKKQYKKLAMTMHPDKNPSPVSEEAFKLVGEAARVLSDRIRRKEYDTRLRVALQSLASSVSGLAAEETFRTACSTCQGLHQFDRKYLGHNLMCPSCKKTFKAVEVEEAGSSNGAALEKNESVGIGTGLGVVQTRESARLKERVARGESIRIVERCGLGMKKKVGKGANGSTPKVAISTDDDYLLKDLVPKILNKKVVKSGEEKGGENGWIGEVGVENGSSRLEVNEATGNGGAEVVDCERAAGAMEEGNMTLLQMKMSVKKKNKLDETTMVEMNGKEVASEKMKPTKKRERGGDLNGEREYEKEKDVEIEIVERDENHENEEDKEEGVGNSREMENGKKATRKGNKKRRETLKVVERDTDYEQEKNEEEIGSKKKRGVEKKLTRARKKTRRDTSKEAERDTDYETEKSEEETGTKKTRKGGNKENGEVNKMEKKLTSTKKRKENEEEIGSKKKRGVEKKLTRDRKKTRRDTSKEAERDTDYETEKSEEETGTKKTRKGGNKENGEVNKMESMLREKRVRRCVSRYGSLETLQSKTSSNHADKGSEPCSAKKHGNVEVVPVEASDFHDFDKDRMERSFKKGQVWAAYDDSDGMPRHYALIDEIVSVHPFEVALIWLQVDSVGQGESTSHISCGNFKTANRVSVKYLNLFSHAVDSARAARQVYRIYPKKGSIWAMYHDSVSDTQGRNQIDKNKQSFDIVVCLSTYSNVHGLSIAHLEKVPGFKTIFKRRAIGANAVICLGKDDINQFSHQIPSKKLSNEISLNLPKDCWELDPASLPPEFLCES